MITGMIEIGAKMTFTVFLGDTVIQILNARDKCSGLNWRV